MTSDSASTHLMSFLSVRFFSASWPQNGNLSAGADEVAIWEFGETEEDDKATKPFALFDPQWFSMAVFPARHH